ncbi:MAG: flavodoxin family protein [Sphaerochaetaceae bacterium]|nr:flavodoxin family protein [Sphaerochaetaceae bacterium]
MKVLMINGSRREKGCTFTALSIVAEALKKEGIDSEICFVGKRAVDGTLEALVDELAEKTKSADGFIFASPVYYASPTGEIQVVLDRLFSNSKAELRYKPAASIASARRAGTTATIDVLNKYATINEMPVVSSHYWTMVHGAKAEDVYEDKEGVETLQILGRNMAWLIKSIEAGKKAGIEQPKPSKKERTNFVR